MTVNPSSRWRQQIHTSTLEVERVWRWLLAVIVLVLLSVTLLLDSHRPFWNDELFTYYISRQPGLAGVWSALSTGAEQLPIFYFFLIRLFTSSTHAGPVAFRLPETLGFLVMCLCAFFFVRKRTPPVYAFVALLLPAVTDAYNFAYEARPYGLVMGFSGLAVLCWQHATQHTNRLLALVGLTCFLACATNSHYYAVLLLFPFGLAELVRYLQTRRLDLPLYAALLLSLSPLIFALPLIRGASRFSSHFWAKPGWTSLISFYENVFMPAGLALLLIILISGAYLFNRPSVAREVVSRPRLIVSEVALALGFALLPVVIIVLAKFVTGAFTSRYAIYSVLGIAILLAWSVAQIGGYRPALGLALSGALLACWLVLAVRQDGRFRSSAQEQATTFRFLRSHEGQLPIVITSPHVFFVQSYWADRGRQNSPYYLADVPLALQYSNTDTVERGLLALKNYAPLHVEDYRTFVAAHPQFLLYGQPGAFGWAQQELIRTGRTLSVVASNGDDLLFLVCPVSPQSR